MSAVKTLEQELQEAFLQAKFDRLFRFAWWCARDVAVSEVPPTWREALDLVGRRARGEVHPAAFAGRADEIKFRLPLAASIIGLKHGAPNAMQLLTIAAALDPGPLTAALQASRNQRRYESMVWTQSNDSSGGTEAPVVALDRPRLLNDEQAPPSVSELRCADRQLQAWQALNS